MENFATIRPPPPPQGIRLRSSSVNQDQALLSRLHAGTRLVDHDQSLQSLEQIHSKLDEIEERDEFSSRSRTQDDWVISIKEDLAQLHRLDGIGIWSKLCIYKIPKYLQVKSYCPQTVSLGPYHNGEKHLQYMESHKGRAVNKVLMRSNQCLEVYIDAMRELEEKARACYEGVISMSSNDFTKMLVFDGCFVLEILIGAIKGYVNLGYAPNDPVFALRESMHLIQRDMMMLENQLPLFVLNRLLELQLHKEEMPTNFVAYLAIQFFDPLILRGRFLNKVNKNEEMVHFLDVYRHSLALPKLYNRRTRSLGPRVVVVDKRPQHIIHCVTKLRDVGIYFRERDSNHFWDITFQNGYLEIPKLFIHEGTKSFFLNLIAFEQCHINTSNAMTSYIIFMDNLIDSAEDVSYLKKCGIIEHWLESDSEVADLFNQIGRQGIVFDILDSYLFDLSMEVANYYDHRNKYFRKWYTWMKTLKEKYFDSPWAYISFLAAFILLVLTSLQCYYAAYAHYIPSSS